MNICMITSFFLPTIGGVENHVYHLTKELKKMGHDVTVVHTCFDIENNEEKDCTVEYVDGIEVHRLYLGVMKSRLEILGICNINSYVNGFLRKARPIKYSKKISDYILKLHNSKYFDLLHQHDFISNLFTTKKLKKYMPIVLTNHTGEYLLLKRYAFTRMILPLLLNHIDYIIGPSKELANVTSAGKEIKSIYIANGCDIDSFVPLSSNDILQKKIQLGLPTKNKFVLCARRWGPTKGVIYLVRSIKHVVAKHPEVKFLISGNDYYGYPEYRKEILRIIHEDNIANNIILWGDIPHNKMAAYDQVADIVVLPSLLEATSLSGLEAMSCGKPLIGSNVGGIPEIIDDGKTGLLVPKKSVESLTAAIDSLLSNEELTISMGKRARKRAVEEFSWKVVAKRTYEVYKKVVK